MCHVVIVFTFVRGSKWTSGMDKRGFGGGVGGDSGSASDSKSETSNQSSLEMSVTKFKGVTIEM